MREYFFSTRLVSNSNFVMHRTEAPSKWYLVELISRSRCKSLRVSAEWPFQIYVEDGLYYPSGRTWPKQAKFTVHLVMRLLVRHKAD